MKSFYETFDDYWLDLTNETTAASEDKEGVVEYLEGLKPVIKKTWEIAWNSGVIEHKHSIIKIENGPTKKFNKRY